MTVLVLAMLLMFSLTAHAGNTGCTWCVCKGLDDKILQQTLDFACGHGADCVPTHKNGPCFAPDTVRAHCNYAVNSYYQKHGQAPGSCDFAGTTSISTTDPSYSGCSFPATLSSAGASTTPTPVTTNPTKGTPTTGPPTIGTPTTGTPTTTTPSSSNTNTPSSSNTTPSTTSPYNTTPSNGVLGGIGNGMSPPVDGLNTDITDDGFQLQPATFFLPFTALLLSGLLLLMD